MTFKHIIGCLLIGGFLVACNSKLPTKDKNDSPLELLTAYKIDCQNFEIFLRAFKQEKILELWAKNKSSKLFTKIQTYDFCTSSGVLGPKRQEGDLQIPEGCYWIDRFNPNSRFHLSLGLNYPNDSDRILGHPQYPGSDIFIHGGCASVGCIPITNKKIEELYAIAQTAKDQGQTKIQVHIFPSQNMQSLIKEQPSQASFWKNLWPLFHHFETYKQIPSFWIESNGAYILKN